MKKKIILSVVAVLLIIAGIFIYKNWRHYFLRDRVPKLVFLQSDSLYRISYDDVYIDEINGEIRIDNLRLIPDTTYKKSKDSSLPAKLMEVFVRELHITDLRTDEALLNEEIVAGKVQLTSPVVTMYNNRYAAKRPGRDSMTTSGVYKVILRSLKRIQIDSILIRGAYYNIVDWITGDTLLTSESVNAHLYHLNISDSASRDNSRILFSKTAELTIPRMYLKKGNGMYNYRFDSIAIVSDDSSFSLKHIYVVPLLGEAAFARAAGYQKDRFNFDFTGLRFININTRQLLEGNIIADSLHVNYAMLKIFRDRNYPRKNENKVGKYPQQALMKVPIDIALKHVAIKNGYIEYKEKSSETDSSGKIRFHDVRLALHNVTNRQQDLQKNRVMLLDLKSNFLDKVPLSASIRFYQQAGGRFAAQGTIGAADAQIFNQLIMPMGLASVEKGKLNKLSFNITGNDYGSKGQVVMLYEDLKIKMLKMDKEKNEYDGKDILSFIANLKVKNSNPAGNKPARKASITYERDIYRSFFNLLWKSIFVGIKEAVGMKQK